MRIFVLHVLRCLVSVSPLGDVASMSKRERGTDLTDRADNADHVNLGIKVLFKI